MESGEQHPPTTRFFRSNVLSDQLLAFQESDHWKTTKLLYPDAHIG